MSPTTSTDYVTGLTNIANSKLTNIGDTLMNNNDKELEELRRMLKEIEDDIEAENKLRVPVKESVPHRIAGFFIRIVITGIMIVHSVWLLVKFAVKWIITDIYYVGRLLYLLLSIVFLKMISMDKNTLLLLSSAIAVLLLMK